jgi:hypothetical protein
MKEYFKLEAIKRILVEMAVNDLLPMDMTELAIHAIGEKAEERLKIDENYIRATIVEELASLVSEDNVSDALSRLEAQAEIDGSIPANEIVTIWEPLEDKGWTVDELLNRL